jgi:2-polyprenyl-3-methyl-5-hydroxy-6-metoxy-1,4-benzoquinol methylase
MNNNYNNEHFLTEQTYWDGNWDASELPIAVDISPGILKNPVNRRLNFLFREFLSDFPAKTKLLEVGCANSAWLPYFASEYSFDITGLDFSEQGCQQTKQILLREGIKGKVICSNLFNPPDEMWQCFDVVISFGVVEHFKPTTYVLSALKNFLRPGGIIITLVPNLNGLVGFMQKKVNRPIYDLHVPLTKNELREAHVESGFDVLFCDYYIFADFYVDNAGDTDSGIWIKILKFMRLLTKSIWAVENAVHQLPSNRYSSPYVICIAKAFKSA